MFVLGGNLCRLVSPNRVYRHAHYQKTHKNQYARDDPAFLVLLWGFLCVSSILCGIAFGLSFSGVIVSVLCASETASLRH